MNGTLRIREVMQVSNLTIIPYRSISTKIPTTNLEDGVTAMGI